MKRIRPLAILLTLLGPSAAWAFPIPSEEEVADTTVELVQNARTCKQVRSCREAVELWCGGYRRADADNDGIPCENVCRTKEEVDAIRKDIGC